MPLPWAATDSRSDVSLPWAAAYSLYGDTRARACSACGVVRGQHLRRSYGQNSGTEWCGCGCACGCAVVMMVAVAIAMADAEAVAVVVVIVAVTVSLVVVVEKDGWRGCGVLCGECGAHCPSTFFPPRLSIESPHLV